MLTWADVEATDSQAVTIRRQMEQTYRDRLGVAA